MSLTRHAIREEAFQVLFALQNNSDADLETVYQSIPHHDEKQIPAYVKQVVTGVSDHQAELDNQISSLLASGWTINRLAKADLIILRLALYEIQYVDEVPTAVAINEALELTKTFSNDKSRKFINGALGKFEKDHNL
ncbi:transcription antitermination factor NusB [Limosilactobacillus viscerum]|uniref:transcription antitermination factor NusB n=1 Tax=Limosilactobacillus viscerum TaxID=2993450 RepID=UPI0024B8AEA9|nr:transcription antitermination factor NusB [Limosilactobacillus viscerum]